MSEQELENENESKLPTESWNNQPQPEPISDKTRPFLQQFISDVSSASASDDLNFQSGDSIKLKFYMDNPETGMKTKSMPVWDKQGNMLKDEDGKTVKKDQTKPNMVVYNYRDKVKQNWWIANRWALLAAETMDEYKTDTLVVKRVGKRQDTVYTFMPTTLERIA